MNQIADRLFLSLLTLTIVLAGFFQNQFNFEGERLFSSLALLMFGLLSVVALLDVLINDLLPKQYRFRTAIRIRQAVWLWMGVTYVGYAFVNVKGELEPWVIWFCILCAIRSAAIAFIDLRETINSVRKNRRASDHFSRWAAKD